MRTTQSELGALAARLADAMTKRGADTRTWALERWAPGDGLARYRIESDGGARHPMGERYRNAAEMASALRFALDCVYALPEVMA